MWKPEGVVNACLRNRARLHPAASVDVHGIAIERMRVKRRAEDPLLNHAHVKRVARGSEYLRVDAPQQQIVGPAGDAVGNLLPCETGYSRERGPDKLFILPAETDILVKPLQLCH